MTASSLYLADPAAASSGVAFGSLIDFARLQMGTGSAEICEACSTINMGSARFCKGCSHKLPAFYAERDAGSTMPNFTPSSVAPGRGWTWDLAAFCLVIDSLVIVTTLMPAA
jgi:hypothetical protein